MKRPRVLNIADLFCGAGGTTTGGSEAALSLGYAPKVTAINHWPIAIATHTANHADARHLCASLDEVNPRNLFKEGELDVLLASPECMSHSNARGGRPVNDQSRATAWCVLRWADALRPPFILIENVPEFEHWAPIGGNGRPLKSKRGEIFQAWLDALRALGYTVGHKILCAANFGDPTTRRRLFIQAVRGRRKIVWPHATHSSDTTPGLFGQSGRAWVPARDIINWQLKGTSIFGRKKPLAEKTIARILEGAEKFWPQPFVVALRGTSAEQISRSCRSVDQPTQTVAGGNHLYLAEPFIIPNLGERKGQKPRVHKVADPLPTVTSHGAGALVQPFLVQVNHGNGKDANGNGRRVKSVNKPLPTVCGQRGEWAVCEPFILPQNSANNPRSILRPAPTLTTTSRGVALVEAFVISAGGPECGARPVSQPMGTVLCRDHRAVVEPLLIPQQSGGKARPISSPIPTVSTAGAISVVQPLLIEFYGNGQSQKVSDPLPTVTTKDRFGLARPVLVTTDGRRFEIDILFRMLNPTELAGAQGFPVGYQFTGTKTQVVKQIGNAVPRRLARALVASMLSQNPDVSYLED